MHDYVVYELKFTTLNREGESSGDSEMDPSQAKKRKTDETSDGVNVTSDGVGSGVSYGDKEDSGASRRE